MKNPHVIIIGAGAAGLAAARLLSDNNIPTTILEARSRIGGRIFTLPNKSLGMPIELGAEFIHGRPDITLQLARQARLHIYDIPFEHTLRRAGNLVKSTHYFDQLSKALAPLARLGNPDMSFAEYLRTYCRGHSLATARRVALDFVQGFDAADPERISAQSIAAEEEGLGDLNDEPQYRLLQGYGALVNHLRHQLNPRQAKLHLNKIVSEIHWKKSYVEVRCAGMGGIFHASRAIITLPVGILQLPPESPHAIRFTPDIPQIRHVASLFGSGAVVKVLLRFHEDAWQKLAASKSKGGINPLQSASFLHNPGSLFPTWWTARPLQLPLLTGWVGGPKALKLSTATPQAIKQSALQSLSTLLGRPLKTITAALAEFHHHNWPADPFSHGAYSYITVGNQNAHKRLGTPIKQTLYFAGEAADTAGQASTVAGALTSGERAARWILKD